MLVALLAALTLVSDDDVEQRRAKAQAECAASGRVGKELTECTNIRTMTPEQREFFLSVMQELLMGGAKTWAPSVVKVQDWRIEGGDGETLILTKSAAGAPPLRRAWVRTERRTAEYSVKSSVALMEFDCAGLRYRALQTAIYPENNMTGAPHSQTIESPAWTYPVPASFSESILKGACEPVS